MKYSIYKTYYQTYEEVEVLTGDKKKELVYKNLNYEEAMKLVKELGYEYGAFPQND